MRVPTVLLALLVGIGTSASAQTAVVEYYHVDAVGSVRAVTNQAGQVVRTHHYFAFGDGNDPAPPSNQDPLRFAGKPRDAETGLDYFGARHYRARSGRFTTVDPVMNIEAALTDSQRWNRYAYALNNPIRYIDPDGRDVPRSCSTNSQCPIVVTLNVISDTGSSVSTAEQTRFKDQQLAGAQKQFGSSNIKLSVGYSSGRLQLSGGTVTSTGLNQKAVNVVLNTQIPGARSGNYNGTAVTLINSRQARSNTLIHELKHVFSGDAFVARPTNPFAAFFSNLYRDSANDFRIWWNPQLLRTGLEPRAFAEPDKTVTPPPKR